MKRRWLSTSARLALLVMGSFLVAVVLIGGGLYYAVSSLLLHDARDLVHADVVTLADAYREGGRAGLLAELQARIHGDDGDPDAVYALEANGVALIGRRPYVTLPGPRGRWIEFIEQEPETGDSLRVLAYEQRLPGGEILLVGRRLQASDRLLELMQQAALRALLAAVALAALAGWLTSRWVAGRLRGLDATAARVGAGELGLRAPLDHSGDAFDQVAARFNAMLDRIEELLDGVRHVTDHIAHDLRTPLTRLRNRLETLAGQTLPVSAQQSLDAAIDETDRLLQTFSALLRLARIESQALPADVPVLSLTTVVEDAIELYAPIASKRDIHLHAHLQPVTIRGDRDQLFQLMVNLLDNALKYSPAGAEVEVVLELAESGVRLQVADHGPGIPESERERVFDRFQRLEAHRGSPGTGLGLSLVRAIVRYHGGAVSLLDNAPGLRVLVMLPAS